MAALVTADRNPQRTGMGPIAALIGAVLTACALSKSATEELSNCQTSDDCPCGQHCVRDDRGVRTCEPGCATNSDCTGFDRCDTSLEQECNRNTGQCCEFDSVACGDQCCAFPNDKCNTNTGQCCEFDTEVCGPVCCDFLEPRCCDNAFCCDTDELCCGHSCCPTFGFRCSNDQCIADGEASLMSEPDAR